MRGTTLICITAALGGLLFMVGCEDKNPSAQLQHIDAGADKYAMADPKLAKALQAATAGSTAALEGPPPDGVFAPGIADQRHPKGQPTTVELVSEGTEPRISMGSPSANDAAADGTRASAFGPAVLELAMQMGPRLALPTIDRNLVVTPAKGDDGNPDWLSALVKRATAAKEQLGQLPPDVDRAIGTLNGTEFVIKVTADGRSSDVRVNPSKTSLDELQRVAHHAAEALVLATVPAPSKPVGVGAQWMAETRMPWTGMDVIAYRAFRVKSIENNRVLLAVDVKAYATTKDTVIEGVPKGATLEQVDAQAQGELEAASGEPLARRSQIDERVVMVFMAPNAANDGQPVSPDKPGGNMLTAQIQAQATFVRGEDPRALARTHPAR